ncbi:hypothetical protein JCM8097_007218 [Rhodosporidiobolus ruineniae]
MCRWIAYFSEQPILITDVIERPEHSLLKQIDLHFLPGIQHPAADSGLGSMNALTNVDGWGLAWYSDVQAKYRTEDRIDPRTGQVRRVELPKLMPTVLKSVLLPVHDLNLRSVAKTVESSVVFGHMCATVGSPVAVPNCHPFQFGRWSFMHNGAVGPFSTSQDAIRSLLSPATRDRIQGTTDTETVAALFFTHLEPHGPWYSSHSLSDIVDALRRTIMDLIRICTPSKGWHLNDGRTPRTWLSLNLAITDGERFVALRYAYPSEREPPSLYWSSVGGSALDRRYKVHPSGGTDIGPVPNEQHLPHVVVASEPMTREKADQWHKMQSGQLLMVDKTELAQAAEDNLYHTSHPVRVKNYWQPDLEELFPAGWTASAGRSKSRSRAGSMSGSRRKGGREVMSPRGRAASVSSSGSSV